MTQPIAGPVSGFSKSARRADRAPERTYYEFFAGGGMVSTALAGMGAWRCCFANDIDEKKAETFRANHKDAPFRLCPVEDLTIKDLPPSWGTGGAVDLCWASFPCQDLSLAGGGAGLSGPRSGTFWAFERLMARLVDDGRAPKTIVLENVAGAATRRGGRDLVLLAEAMCGLGYRVGAVLLDASHFTPQSRQRLFVVAINKSVCVPEALTVKKPFLDDVGAVFQKGGVITTEGSLINWKLPSFPNRNKNLEDIVEAQSDVRWASSEKTVRLLDLMDERHRKKIAEARRQSKARGRPSVGTVFRRMRSSPDGGRVQRAEVRFDGLAGCLRTPAGGSSRQTILSVEPDRIRSRLLTPREAARLMGLPEDYRLPAKTADAYRLLGDGVVAPVVDFLVRSLIEPVLDNAAGGLDPSFDALGRVAPSYDPR
ncbi:MAG: DNA cytosine methyltransferase [Pseudomonadota bacterium]